MTYYIIIGLLTFTELPNVSIDMTGPLGFRRFLPILHTKAEVEPANLSAIQMFWKAYCKQVETDM